MTEKDPKEEGRGFRVIDRRGESRDEPEPERAETVSEPVTDTVAQEASLPEEDAFAHFIMSLATSAYMHLGMVAPPGDEKMEKNLPLAKQSIDILGMIAEKTQGNLTAKEEALLQQLLSELRLHFVNEQKTDSQKKD
jgi:hypothetical protein